MTARELRNHLARELDAYTGRPVYLSGQTVPEGKYPYIYYQAVAPYMQTGVIDKIRETVASADPEFAHDILTHRVELPHATYSFSACSRNRETDSGFIYGDDEAMDLAERAQGFFLHVGKPRLRELGISVIEVMNVTDRSGIVVDEVDRRWGFDIRVRYKRVDTRRDAVLFNGLVKDGEP